jgi:ketosteroid isomerase-like protein
MRKFLCLAVVLCVALPAIAREDERKIEAAPEDRYREWLAAENKKDAAMITDFYDENAVLMPSKEDPVIGKTAIGEWYKKLVADPRFVPFSLTLDWNSFHLAGDIAIATSVFEGDLTRNGKQIRFRGKNLLVWKKQEDSSWKIFRYMYDEIPAKK